MDIQGIRFYVGTGRMRRFDDVRLAIADIIDSEENESRRDRGRIQDKYHAVKSHLEHIRLMTPDEYRLFVMNDYIESLETAFTCLKHEVMGDAFRAILLAEMPGDLSGRESEITERVLQMVSDRQAPLSESLPEIPSALTDGDTDWRTEQDLAVSELTHMTNSLDAEMNRFHDPARQILNGRRYK